MQSFASAKTAFIFSICMLTTVSWAQTSPNVDVDDVERAESASSARLERLVIQEGIAAAGLVASGVLVVTNHARIQEAERLIQRRLDIDALQNKLTVAELSLDPSFRNSPLDAAEKLRLEGEVRALSLEIEQTRIFLANDVSRFKRETPELARLRRIDVRARDLVSDREIDRNSPLNVERDQRRARFLRKMGGLGLGASVALHFWNSASLMMEVRDLQESRVSSGLDALEAETGEGATGH
jgi:hypothetical protein